MLETYNINSIKDINNKIYITLETINTLSLELNRKIYIRYKDKELEADIDCLNSLILEHRLILNTQIIELKKLIKF